MKFIEPRVHGFIDYFIGILLVVGPTVFNFENAIEVFIPTLFGVIEITTSLLTRYEFGLFPVISLRKHLRLDMITGALLIASPWIFGFAGYIWQPHVFLGGLQMLVALFTKTYSHKKHHRRHGVGAHQ
jgi:hypothetical protein